MNKKEHKFTLLELVAVIVILGILSVVAIPHYISLKKEAFYACANAAISEYSSREKQLWADHILKSDYDNDEKLLNALIFTEMDPFLDAHDYDNINNAPSYSAGNSWEFQVGSFGNYQGSYYLRAPYLCKLWIKHNGDKSQPYFRIKRQPATLASQAIWSINSYTGD